MKTVKTFAAILIMTCFLSNSAFAQTDKKMESKMDKKEDSKMDKMDSKMDHKMDKMATLKDHKCTAACKNGKHMYAHGEKAHVCGEACKKMMDKKGKA